MITHDAPFIFFDDARADNPAPSRLYQRPAKIITANSLDELPAFFAALRQGQMGGYHIAGFLGYEAGYGLQNKAFQHIKTNQQPLAWFGFFEEYQIVDSAAVASYLPDPAGAYLSPFQSDTGPIEYRAAFDRVQDYIRAGDIYQANLTFRATARYAGNPLALYAAIRRNAAAGYGAALWTGAQWILSFSPELFFPPARAK